MVELEVGFTKRMRKPLPTIGRGSSRILSQDSLIMAGFSFTSLAIILSLRVGELELISNAIRGLIACISLFFICAEWTRNAHKIWHLVTGEFLYMFGGTTLFYSLFKFASFRLAFIGGEWLALLLLPIIFLFCSIIVSLKTLWDIKEDSDHPR